MQPYIQPVGNAGHGAKAMQDQEKMRPCAAPESGSSLTFRQA
jgi:hypothetical protein